MFDPTLHRGPTPTKEPGRALHSIDPEGFATVERRAPRQGELFADTPGPEGWVFRATADHHEPQRVVRAQGGSVFPS